METPVPLAEILASIAKTIVHAGEVTMKSTKSPAVEAPKSAPVEPASMKPAAIAVETPATAVETPAPAPAMGPSVGEIWLAERGSAQQSSCDGQSPSDPRPGFMFG
jgi:hypothetical protein